MPDKTIEQELAEAAAAVVAKRRDAARNQLLTDARASVDAASAALKSADETITDETRMSIMGTLRAAIHSINEAG